VSKADCGLIDRLYCCSGFINFSSLSWELRFNPNIEFKSLR
jgi:hypothetical protein